MCEGPWCVLLREHTAGFTEALPRSAAMAGKPHPPSGSLREVGRDVGAESANPC